MKKDLIAVLFIFLITPLVWWQSLFNFFTQDDFILIWHFSQNNLVSDLKNVFGQPITHWRPVHNLYYFIGGNLFEKNYIGFHLLTLAFQGLTAFFVFKIGRILTKNGSSSLAVSILYLVHPAHFVSMFWISGTVPTVGFLLLTASLWSFLIKRKGVSLLFFVLAIFASETMSLGFFIFAAYEFLFKRKKIDKQFLSLVGSISLIFLVVRLALFIPRTAFDIYKPEISYKVLWALKYYIFRIAGFAEPSGDKLLTILLLAWLLSMAVLLIKDLSKDKRHINSVFFPLLIIIIGLFPFILIPSHLSPHYMNISIFGFSLFLSTVLKPLKPLFSLAAVLAFIVIAIVNISLTKGNNWVIKRSNIAKGYLYEIEKQNLPEGSVLVFGETAISTSEDAYISLGTGEAIKFWFKNKNYKTCFTRFEKCPTLP